MKNPSMEGNWESPVEQLGLSLVATCHSCCTCGCAGRSGVQGECRHWVPVGLQVWELVVTGNRVSSLKQVSLLSTVDGPLYAEVDSVNLALAMEAASDDTSVSEEQEHNRRSCPARLCRQCCQRTAAQGHKGRLCCCPSTRLRICSTWWQRHLMTHPLHWSQRWVHCTGVKRECHGGIATI